ncbi:tetratricopeptide repeat protein [Tardiphaga sp.]|uniref:tetratricopeptide repeat protein n=1 Tax=Tardiphaga sp. TaxID=1926292 RepID=UPI00352ADE9E
MRRAERLQHQGIEHARDGQWKAALAAFGDAIRLAPDLPNLNFEFGVALCRADRFEDAITAFHRELHVSPKHGPAAAEIGTCLARTGRPAEGIPFLQRGLRLHPNMPLAQFSLGLALLTENRRREALEALDQALLLDASCADAYRTRGLALAMDGQLERAVEDLRAATALDSNNSNAIIELGRTFGLAAREREAGQLFETAARIAPHLALPQYYYGQYLINHRHFQRGLDHVERAIAIDPLYAENYIARGFGLLGQGRVEEAVGAFRHAAKLNPDSSQIAGTLLFALQHKPGVTERELFNEHKRWAELFRLSPPHDRLLFRNAPQPERKPKLGIVSADLHRHAAAFLTLPAFEQLAQIGFPIVCYKTDRKRIDDDFSERFKVAAVAWRDISDRDDAAVIEQITADGIDILFDLSGHTAGSRLGVFERRAAPIQLGWAGYVGTVGLDTYDGILADAVEIPPGHDDCYVEPVIRLPDCYVSYHPPIDAPSVGPLPSLVRQRFTFGCFNRPAKLNAAVAESWGRIFAQLPDAHLLMVYGGLDESATRAAVLRVLSRGGIDPERVELVGEKEQAGLVRAYRDVDLALDPFPYSGGVTTLEAMWMGVPVVTLVGDTFAGRHSASHLTAAGLPEFCAKTREDYVALAIDWSRRRNDLDALRGSLRARLASSPLCDAPRFAQNLARELIRLWADWCAARRAHAAEGEPLRQPA